MIGRIFSYVCTCILASLLFSFTGEKPGPAQQKPVLGTIIIDAGHGGVDHGAEGLFSTESNVALSISMKLGKAIEKELPDTKIIYTRTTDILPGGGDEIKPALRYRADLANQAKGDLYIAIHANASGEKAGGWYAKRVIGHKNVTKYVGKGAKRRKKIVREPIYESYYVKNTRQGTETYIWAADRSGIKGDFINKTDEGGESVEDSANVLDLNSPEARIRAQLYEKKFFAKSLTLGNMIEQEFAAQGRLSEGVKQRNEKGIWVLQATGMPSVLVETGFITNEEEEKYINSDEGQDEIVNAIVAALKRYKGVLEQGRNIPNNPPDTSTNQK
jgi:N-acetylmuramoyl-L-alanine amidase